MLSSLNAFSLSGRRHVRPDAEIDEGVLVLDRVAGDFALALGLLVDQLHLERLAALREERLGLFARPHLALVDADPAAASSFIFCSIALEILGHERPRDDEVVEEPFVGRRADAALHAWKQVRDGGRQQMRRAVTVERQRFRAAVGHDADRRVLSGAETTGRPACRRRCPRARRWRGRGEISAATSRTGVPAGTVRLDPSGSVTVTWLIRDVWSSSGSGSLRLDSRALS